jgi:alkylhydroperoxidase family enzyme
MRLAPIENPRQLVAKIAYWMTKRRLGKVMTPMKVVYARVPALFRLAYGEVNIVEKKLKIDPTTSILVRTWAAMINECTFCVDIAKAVAIHQHMTMEKLEALPQYRTSALFTPRERAALAYAEEATRTKHVSDATFAELRRHFDEREIVEITWLNALENYYNLINLPLQIESDGLCAIATRRAERRAAA